MNTTISAEPILAPEQVRPLLLEPTVNDSVVGQIATVQYIDGPQLRVPRMGSLDVADWIGEGAEIPLGDVEFSEISFIPQSLKGGSVVTQEAMDDTSPEAAALIGAELARDLARKIDIGFFGSNAANPDDQPPGLQDLTGHHIIIDPDLISAFYGAAEWSDTIGAPIDAWVCHPSTATDIARLNLVRDQAMPLPYPDPSVLRREAFGRPIISSPNVAAGEIWGFNKASTWLVIRTDAEIEADKSVFFTSYRVALRSRIRATYGFTRPDAVIQITGVTWP